MSTMWRVRRVRGDHDLGRAAAAAVFKAGLRLHHRTRLRGYRSWSFRDASGFGVRVECCAWPERDDDLRPCKACGRRFSEAEIELTQGWCPCCGAEWRP
jgi:hypothetical protein